MSSNDDEITLWMRRLSTGDPQGAERIWAAYFERLVAYASRMLVGVPRRAADEEDIALSAMHSFCRGLREGRYEGLRNRHDLWRLLVTITGRKVFKEIRQAKAIKRGGVTGLAAREVDEQDSFLHQVVGREPTPEFACLVADNCRLLLERLGEESLRLTALAKLEGYTNAEIAEQLGCSLRSVERKLELIRAIWSQDGESE